MVNACRDCVNCRNGDEQYCLDGMVATYGGVEVTVLSPSFKEAG